MVSTHRNIIEREEEKYSKRGWITAKEVAYNNYIFDLIALEPKTKELHIVEVDVAHETSEEKIEFAKTLGKVKIFRPYHTLKNTEIVPRKIQPLLNSLSNPIRIAIIEVLGAEELRYFDLIRRLGFNHKRESGKFGYHLNLLQDNGLVYKNKAEKYALTQKGTQILDLIIKLDELC